MNRIFLGEPPANIKQWIIEHYTPPTPAAGPLCFTAEQDGSSVSLIGWDDDMYQQIDIFASLQYSTDNSTWQEWDGHVINLNAGQKVYIKALNPNPNGMAKNDGMQYHKFIFEGKIAASGNIQYLLEDTGSRTDVPKYAYYHLFAGVETLSTFISGLTSAPKLPATKLAADCYSGMFYGCTSLTTAPELPATTLANGCYTMMFACCIMLDHAPVLPAKTLADECYWGMFEVCTLLTEAPELPAETLADDCYEVMFFGCTSLNSAPQLLATTLANRCYQEMFGNCNSFSDCHMKASMRKVYKTSIHGDTKKTVIYDL